MFENAGADMEAKGLWIEGHRCKEQKHDLVGVFKRTLVITYLVLKKCLVETQVFVDLL